MAEDTPKTSFNADVVDAKAEGVTGIQPCTVETDTHKFIVQTGPSLIVAVDKKTGEEVHHTEPEAIAGLWGKIKAYVAEELKSLEDGDDRDEDDAA